MNSLSFIRNRAQASWAAQAAIASLWVYKLKTVLQWSDDVALLEQLGQSAGAKRTAWRNAAALWDASLAEIQAITRLVIVQARNKYAKDPVKLKPFLLLSAPAGGRQEIYDLGFNAYHEWQNADPAWTVTHGAEELQLGTLGSLLSASLAQRGTYRVKLSAWRSAASALMNKARAVDADNVAWYAEATRRFAPGTEQGDMIRSTVPTTAVPEKAVGQAAIANVMLSGATAHFDFSAPHGTHFTVLQQSPGSPAFLIVVAETVEKSFTAHDLPPGVYRFKVFGSNSKGEGEESAVAEFTIAAAAAA